jgi:anti-anti-sigma factor
MTFQREIKSNVLVLTPHKNLVGGQETLALLKTIDEFAATRPPKVVVDMGELNWVSSLGVGMLRKASITCDEGGGWLRLARITKIIENTLLVTGLIIYFETFETVELAVTTPARDGHRWPSGRPPRKDVKHPEV